MEITEWIIAGVKGLSETGVYLVLFISSVIENIFPPFPGDTVTAFCGFLAAHEVISLPLAFLVALTGHLTGAWIMYFAGERILNFARQLHQKIKHPVFLKKMLSELVSEKTMGKTKKWFLKWGVWFVAFSRFSAGIRFFVSIIAGISQMNLVVFSLAFTFGALIWNALLLVGGYMLGDNWELILEVLKIYNQVIIFFMLAIVVIFIYWKFKRNRNRKLSEQLGSEDSSSE